MRFDQLIINGVASNDDFDATIKERTISQPKKKAITETVPFSNQIYDFSGIDGEIYWESRSLEYIFEIVAETPEELEEKKRKFLSWIMFVQDGELYDPYITDFYFKATFDSAKPDDSEIEKTTIAVSFTAYPYKIAKNPKKYAYNLDPSEKRTVVVYSDAAHRVVPTLTTTTPFVMAMDDIVYSVPEGETTDDTFMIPSGSTEIVLQNIGESTGTLTISFREEVM